MFDINFFKNSFDIKSRIISNELSNNDIEEISKELEFIRDKNPKVFNIETTNYCNMKCVMCARTIYMKRKNIWINDELFEKLLEKVKPYSQNEINDFWKWLKQEANQDKNEISENGFYFSIVSKHLILHGFGEPFLDKYLIKRIKACQKKKYSNLFFLYTGHNDS